MQTSKHHLVSILFLAGGESNHNLKLLTMSATVGNIEQVASFLKANVFRDEEAHTCIDQYAVACGVVYKVVQAQMDVKSGQPSFQKVLVRHRELQGNSPNSPSFSGQCTSLNLVR